MCNEKLFHNLKLVSISQKDHSALSGEPLGRCNNTEEERVWRETRNRLRDSLVISRPSLYQLHLTYNAIIPLESNSITKSILVYVSVKVLQFSSG